MRDKQRQKGVALFMVSGLALIIFASIMGLLFMLDANIRNLEAIKERTQAYYLCEVGASAAILDIRNGRIGTKPGHWTEKEFDYPMGDKTYRIKYAVTKVAGTWDIVSQVGRTSGFTRTYKLKVAGKRAFPIFIRGWPGQ